MDHTLKLDFVKIIYLEKIARKGQNSSKSDFRGPKIPPRDAIQHGTCSTISNMGNARKNAFNTLLQILFVCL